MLPQDTHFRPKDTYKVKGKKKKKKHIPRMQKQKQKQNSNTQVTQIDFNTGLNKK